MTIDKRFALLTNDGDVLYPYIKTERSSGRTGFALSAPGRRDAHGMADYTRDITEVVRRVIQDGWSVRAKTEPSRSKREGSFGLNKRVVSDFRLDAELALELGLPQSTKNEAPASHQSGSHLSDQVTTKPAVSPTAAIGSSETDPYEKVELLTAADFAQALLANTDRITAAQRAMLIGHAQAPQQALSMEAIALHGGYDNYTAANSQYGRLGRLIADHLGITGLANQTQILAVGSENNDALGHFVWELRPRLAAALGQLGWVAFEAQHIAMAEAATKELDNEGGERAPTTRQALINARIGQGLYREQVLDLWRQRCAVTGCALRSVLIASHARPWKDSSDTQRLDPYNGLPLTASIDKLFDRGLISFADDGRLLRNAMLSDVDLVHLGLQPNSVLRADCLRPHHLPYLAAHRAAHGF